MRFSTTAFALAALAAGAAASDVLDLTPANFESSVKPESLILVEFFAPWCGHCKALAPHYEEAATALKERNIKLAKVDCVENAELCQEHGVAGYPTLKVFREGEPTDYTGPRKADGIISYMVKQSLPAVTDVNAENVKEFKAADKIVLIAYLPTTTDLPGPEFSATANKHRDDYLFGLSTDPAVFESESVTPPALVLYRSFDEPTTSYPYPIGSANVKDIEEWVHSLSLPLVDEIGSENYASYAGTGLPLAYLFLDPTDPEHDSQKNLVRNAATKLRGKMNFGWIDAIKYGDHGKSLNLVEPKWPSFVIQDISRNLKYPVSQGAPLTTAVIEDYAQSVLDGKVEPSLKSQPIPEDQTESVFTLVTKQFDDVVFDNDKDVFVEFYAPWCGHCKRLKPIWDSLGDHYSKVADRITIAKMDATENDIPPEVPFRVTSFPTLKFKKAGSKDFVDYTGDRSLESLIEFVEAEAVNPTDPSVAFNKSGEELFQEHFEAAASGHDEL